MYEYTDHAVSCFVVISGGLNWYLSLTALRQSFEPLPKCQKGNREEYRQIYHMDHLTMTTVTQHVCMSYETSTVTSLERPGASYNRQLNCLFNGVFWSIIKNPESSTLIAEMHWLPTGHTHKVMWQSNVEAYPCYNVIISWDTLYAQQSTGQLLLKICSREGISN